MPREAPSQNLQDFLQLWRETLAALDRGEDRTACLATAERGLRVLFPPVPDTDPRLWLKCLACEDTGWEAVTRHPRLYGGEMPIRFVHPCHCELGEKRRQALADAEQRADERRHGVKKATWARA